MSTKPTIHILPYGRFREFREQREKLRQDEAWSRNFLKDETYLALMSVKIRDDEGIIRRKYEEQIRKEMYWSPIPPHNATIVISAKDLDDKIKRELLSYDKTSRESILKEVIGMICEQVDSKFYLLSAKQFLKVRLEE
jgi:hypothetical protein